jgi:hypothetical protein
MNSYRLTNKIEVCFDKMMYVQIDKIYLNSNVHPAMGFLNSVQQQDIYRKL